MIQVTDNFLPWEEFNTLQSIIMGQDFDWKYSDSVVAAGDGYFQFFHMFFLAGHGAFSPFMDILNPILNIIRPYELVKVKANINPRSQVMDTYPYHIDVGNFECAHQRELYTSILYINTNNGLTKFEDGTAIESVANRIVTFPATMRHTGTNCTDEKVRIVLNLNYT